MLVSSDDPIRQAEIDAAWRLHRAMDRPEARQSHLRPQLRERLAEAQNWRCCYCGVRMEGAPGVWPDGPTFEHVVPRSRGGTNLIDNLAVSCVQCNVKRGNGRKA